ncbi:quaternary ammonium compound efflux SMR transporter SugE [Fictibacillus phosphorivorans]|uniref:quaternary ammonium compound efflux SMR transporter SugE n=1 Tax=Fictibacillus phosphorivorans TaxID=1221500 RepID=UPI00203FE6E1|nr:quaternary ammonium compound efflux SMR transporter SugE [Fictibacillus phosphorivorans]MCM3717541.1 quaternary ammonium compound efflux SMR transporter SugE [Fictibacillus phosphorivorans]MCM3775236.1 quaternary ammonium compound efflux SMR transporter SugE [Fictibacillus phosphorivorans]
MAWVYLFVAGIFEIVWAIGLKYTNGFTRLWPSVITIIGMFISFYFLSQATKVLPIGTAYTIWTGIGAAGAVILGIILFNEPKTLLRLMFLAFVITGIIGLKVTAGSQ